MPVYLRYFYYKRLVDVKNEEKEKLKESQKKSKINRPNINPTLKR